MTLYAHFASKEDLVLAFLEERNKRWTEGWLRTQIEQRAQDPRGRVLAIFDAFDDWFHEADFESCSLTRTLLETQAPDPQHTSAVLQLERIRLMLREEIEGAGVRDSDEIAYLIQTLMLGAIMSASRGDLDAARRVRGLAERLLEPAAT